MLCRSPGATSGPGGLERGVVRVVSTAGRQIQDVFVHECLRAERASGSLEFRRRELARPVGKSRSTLGPLPARAGGQGSVRAGGGCQPARRLPPAVAPSELALRSAGEPARKQGQAEREGPGTAGEASAYVAEVRRLFRQPACVQGRFGTADQRLAAGCLNNPDHPCCPTRVSRLSQLAMRSVEDTFGRFRKTREGPQPFPGSGMR